MSESQRARRNLEGDAVASARSRWLAASEKASELAAELFQPRSGYGDPDARLADEHRLRSSREEAERLFREYHDVSRQQVESQMLRLQRSQTLSAQASFIVAAVVGTATVVSIIIALL